MNINDLKNIFHLVSCPKVIPLKNFLTERRENTKIQELLDGIIAGRITSDDDAAEKIYNAKPSDKKYMVLRSSLLSELIQSIIFYDFSKQFSLSVWQKFILQRKLFAMQALLSFGRRNTATSIAEKALQEANQFEVTEIAIQCLRIMRETASLNGKREIFEKCNKELSQKLHLQEEELRAEGECQSIELSFIKTSSRQEEIAEKALEYIEYLELAKSQISSFALDLYYYRILLYALQIKGEYEKAITVCQQAESLLLHHEKLASKGKIGEFKSTAMTCAMMLRQYDRAVEFGEECTGLFQEGQRNWLTALNRLMLIHFHRQDYSAALEIYSRAVQSDGIESLPSYQRERWLVYKGFLSLFIATGELRPSYQTMPELNIGDLIQETSEIINDKKGLNITILILHILSAIYYYDDELITVRINLFNNYAKRYLTNEEQRRTLLFHQMLKLLRKVRYDPTKAASQGEKHLRRMRETPENPKYILDSHEVVPYEVLWEWILKQLKTYR